MKPPRDPSQAPSKEGPDAADPNPSSHDGPRRSGRVSQDERGNSVWEWQLETGVYSRDISTQRLKKLDLNDLSIADTARHPRPPGLGKSGGEQSPRGGSSNPYDNSPTAGGNVGSNPYNSGGGSTLKPAPKAPPEPRKPMDSKKLQEWMEIRKRAEQKRRDEAKDE